MTHDYKTLFSLVKNSIYSSDPEGLVIYAAPDDEFDNEINRVLSFINVREYKVSVEELSDELTRVFLNNNVENSKEHTIINKMAEGIISSL